MEEKDIEVNLECGDTIQLKNKPRIGVYRFCIHCDARKKVIGFPYDNARQLARDLPGSLAALTGNQRPRARRIQVRPSERYDPAAENKRAEIVLHVNESQSTVLVMSDHEVLEMILQASRYLRDKAEGMFDV